METAIAKRPAPAAARWERTPAFGKDAAFKLLRFFNDGVRPEKYSGLVLDIHSILNGEFGAEALRGFGDALVYSRQDDYSKPTDKRAPKSLPHKNPLLTQSDGMDYAIALMHSMEKLWAPGNNPGSDYSADSKEGDSVYRTGPQNRILLQAFDELHERGERDAILGFHVVWTDFIGTVVAGCVPEAKHYVKERRAARLEPMQDYSRAALSPTKTREANFLNMYHNLTRWQKVAAYIILNSLAYGELNAEMTDPMTFAQFRRALNLPTTKDGRA